MKNKKILKSINTATIIFVAVFLLLLLNSCSPQERKGVTRLPQNRPASWETNAFAR